MTETNPTLDIDIVVPCHDEQDTLAAHVRRLHAFCTTSLHHSWRITIADNASSGAVVLGDWVPLTQAPPLPETTAALVVNDMVVGTGEGTAVMGDPAAAVAWLANALARYGTAIEAGQFVMSGSYTTASFVVAGDRASAVISGLGAVTVSFD